jgi:hypothetical protein
MTGFRRLLRRNRFVISGLVLMMLVGCGAVSSPTTVPVGKALYHDPEGYFSITEEGQESPVIHGGDESPALLDKHPF